jgi:hypothetical protein
MVSERSYELLDDYEDKYGEMDSEERDMIDIHMKDIATDIYIRKYKKENGVFNYSTVCTQKEFKLVYKILGILSRDLTARTELFTRNYEDAVVDFTWTDIIIPRMYINTVINENATNMSCIILERY